MQEKKEQSLHMVFDHAARYDFLSRVEETWLEGMKLFACGQGQTEYETAKDHVDNLPLLARSGAARRGSVPVNR